ncbi:hypothetical protein BaRGS_00036872 [Batillaria attramentaria]|uniref:Transposase putative helix-turn-helix domain-containing protein n=1 Tax=Batillaria attramentaria TaxID=370345 RepID=A0ABD0JB88_9CAEN
MKRKFEPFTLWRAAKVIGCNLQQPTMSGWYRTTLPTDQSTDSGEWPSVETKRAKIEQRQKKVTRVYKIGLRPTKEQRKVLNDCIVVANRAYNLCIELVESKVCQPNQFDLQKMVVKKKECTGEDAWFWNSSTVVRLLATKTFCSAVKAIN